ncbi:MAG TPA: trypsin-like peptidase domain-containing protein [Gaiellaceae bacterium]
MTFDETWDAPRRPRLPGAPLLAAVAGALALAGLAYALVHVSQSLSAERAARHSEVAGLDRRLRALEFHNASLLSRVGSAERLLEQRDAGIAPLAKRVLKSVFTVQTDAGLGTGFVGWQDAEGTYVVTADHVVKDASTGVTLTRSGQSWQGDVNAEDASNDLAVIRLSGHPAGAEPLWQQPFRGVPNVGDELLLVGSPFGLSGTVTSGVVSRVTSKFVQTDAAANPGSSGGPVVDKQGHVVGVLVSGGGENINFAVRIDRVCAKLLVC